MINIALFVAALIYLNPSCNSISTKRQSNIDLNTGLVILDQLKVRKKKNSEIVHLDLSSDTLLIVTTHEFSTYPLGKFSDFNEFETRVFNEKNYNGSTEECSNSNMPVHRYAFDEGYIKVLKPDDGFIDIVFARIEEISILLSHGITIGQDCETVLSVFFDNIANLDFDVISVIRIESGVTGVWQYYTYREGKLESIVIDSDYQCNKM